MNFSCLGYSIADLIAVCWAMIGIPGLVVAGVCLLFLLCLRKRNAVLPAIFLSIVIWIIVSADRMNSYRNPERDEEVVNKEYSVTFSDMQSKQIAAAQKNGIRPVNSRKDVDALMADFKLHRIRSNRLCHVDRLTHSVPYLTYEAKILIDDIGRSFRDSLDVLGLRDYKIVVTSVLRTEEDVRNLMKVNKVAVKNSAHLYGTTFDISYVNFLPCGLGLERDTRLLKRVLADVLQNLRNDGRCYVRYETSQACFHITVRR